MVQSTDSPCFELVSWTDLLEKAGHDLIELELHVNSYSLFNCICTLNHIPDWISADPGYEHLSARVEEIKKERNVETVRQLCNRAKHFSRKKASPTTEVPRRLRRRAVWNGRLSRRRTELFGRG
jgi:hypothetical protein